MLNPTPSDLLAGVADALEATVVPELERGEVRNQVQAAIGIIRRCAGAVDRLGPVLHTECVDLVASLGAAASADVDLVVDREALDDALGAGADVLALDHPSVTDLTGAALALREQAGAMAVAAERRRSDQLGPLRALLDRMADRELEIGLSPW